MLRQIRSIDYQRKTVNHSTLGATYRKFEQEWCVSAAVDRTKMYKEMDDGQYFKNIECYTLNVTTKKKQTAPESKNCVVAKACLRNETVVPQSLRQYVKAERLVANVSTAVPDIAIAATITGETKTSFYNSLPLDNQCGLPVNFHARFAVSPDRRSLRTDSSGGQWNKFLANHCLPQLYFIFLERLLLWHRHSLTPYKLWPFLSGGTPANEITAGSGAAFWNEIGVSRRVLFTDGINTGPILDVIFDTRIGRHAVPTYLMTLINKMKPNSVYVDKPQVINSLFATPRVIPNLKICAPAYLRNLLQENSAKARMNQLAFSDRDLKVMLEFLLVNYDISELEGCRVLRLQDGKLWKVETGTESCLPCANTNVRYCIDKEGFDIFKHIPSGYLISPTVLPWTLALKLTLTPTSNVQRFDGSVVDRLLRMEPSRSELIDTYSDEKSAWVSSVYEYVSSRGLSVASFLTRPMIPVLKKNTFISIRGWHSLRVIPPADNNDMRRICAKLPDFHILANLQFQPLKAVATLGSGEQFLQCLRQFPTRTLEKMFLELLNEEDLKVESVFPS